VARVTRKREVEAPVADVWKLVSDPHSLPRWWPRTARVENVDVKPGGKRSQWTKVLQTGEGRGVRAANELSRVGVGARNLRVFRSSADREANLLEALLGPSLRSRNPERRKEALQSLESLAATVSHLKHLLLVRDLRRLAGD